jgi:hypothetical protein
MSDIPHGTDAVQVIDLPPLLDAAEQLAAAIRDLTAGDDYEETDRRAHVSNYAMRFVVSAICLKLELGKYDLSDTRCPRRFVEVRGIPALQQLHRYVDALLEVVAAHSAPPCGTCGPEVLPPADWVQLLPRVAMRGVQLEVETLRECCKRLAESPPEEVIAPPLPWFPSDEQLKALKELDGKAMTKEALAGKLDMDPGQLGRDVLKELMARGRIANNRRVGGYYRPDAMSPAIKSRLETEQR